MMRMSFILCSGPLSERRPGGALRDCTKLPVHEIRSPARVAPGRHQLCFPYSGPGTPGLFVKDSQSSRVDESMSGPTSGSIGMVPDKPDD